MFDSLADGFLGTAMWQRILEIEFSRAYLRLLAFPIYAKFFVMKAHIKAALVTLFLMVVLVGVFQWWQKGTDPVDHSIDAYQRMERDGLPVLSFKDLKGKEYQLKSFDKGILIISFWASWCGPCVDEFPSLIRLVEKVPSIKVVAPSGDYKVEEIDTFLETLLPSARSAQAAPVVQKDSGKKKSSGKNSGSVAAADISENFVVTWDSEGAMRGAFGILRLPEAFIFLDGKLKRKVVGAINWSDAEALKFFSELK